MIQKPPAAPGPEPHSRIFNVSVRGWLAFILVATVCLNQLAMVLTAVMISIHTGSLDKLVEFKIEEPLYTAVLIAIGFYMGQATKEGSRPSTPTYPAATP